MEDDPATCEKPRFPEERLGGFTKKGTPRYFRKFEGEEDLKGYEEHAYIAVAPHVEIDIPDFGEMSGTTIRKALKDADEETFKDIMDFYDPEVHKMIKSKLSNIQTEGTHHFMGIFRGLVEEVLKEGSIEDFRQNAKHKEVSALAANLQSAYNMHKELNAAYDKAPDKHANREDFYSEKALTDEIIVPYFKEVEQMEKRSDEIDDPSELRNFMKNDFRKTIKKHPIVMKQLYSAAKQKGITLSKPILQIVLQKSARELQHARERLKHVQKLPVETFVPRANAKKEVQSEIASMVGGSVAIGAGSVSKPQRRERKTTEEEVNEALNYLLQKLGV